MVKNFGLYCFVTLLLLIKSGGAQNETKRWFFGAFNSAAGINFNTTPPSLLSNFNASLNTVSGCASICDNSGGLLFYSDGATVWNANHAVMPNGTGIKGTPSNPQSSLIVKRPGSTTKYYLFTIDTYDNVGINTGLYGLRYTEIDMSLASGQGSVTTKNNVMFIPSTEKMAAVKHCNGNDVWLLSHDRNTQIFRAFLITAAGISSVVSTSTVGTIHADYQGYIKFSPDGNKMATSIWPTYNLEIFDFDRSTGIVSNQLVLKTGTDNYGCEFSSDGTKFYSVVNWSQILQWDLCAGTSADILASQTSVGTSTALLYGMQLAPNGKIYVARTGQMELGEIQNPNAGGTACNYVDTGFSIAPMQCYNGLPNFMASYLAAPSPSLLPFTSTFSCQSLSFTPPSNSGSLCKAINIYKWDFGDPASGSDNVSTAANPVHNYINTGTYTVKLILNSNCTSDTLIQTVQVAGCTDIKELNAGRHLFSLAPNPAKSFLNIETPSAAKFEVINQLGEVISTNLAEAGSFTIDISKLNSGIYFIRAYSAQGGRSTKKFIKAD